jgi:hypothetical protein
MTSEALMILMKFLLFCPFILQADNSEGKVNNITMEIIAAINARCSTCGLRGDRITNGQLSCMSKEIVTFRAEIHGTASMTSSELRREIQAFVDTDPSIQVLRVTMTFVDECNVDINSFNEPRCSAESSSQLPPLPIIVGGALGGVIVLMLCGILVISVAVYRRRRNKRKVDLRRRQARSERRIKNKMLIR